MPNSVKPINLTQDDKEALESISFARAPLRQEPISERKYYS